MDIEELQTFVEIARTGGISSAAVRLGVSKSIVSRRLVRLESDLGVQLFSRNARGAFLTEAGLTFRDYAARICSEVDSAKASISAQDELCGRLRIAAPTSFGQIYFAPVFARLARRYPRLEVETSYCDTNVAPISRHYDCAICIGHVPQTHLAAQLIGSLHQVAVASPEYIRLSGAPESMAELSAHQALMRNGEVWRFQDADKILSIRPHGRFESDNCEALVAGALAGLGVAYLPRILVQRFLDSQALIPVMQRYPATQAGVYVVRTNPVDPGRKIQVLAEMLIEAFH